MSFENLAKFTKSSKKKKGRFRILSKSVKSSTIKKLFQNQSRVRAVQRNMSFENLKKSSKSSKKRSRFRMVSKSSKSRTKKYVV